MVKKISIIGSGFVGSILAFSILSRLNIKKLILVDIFGLKAKGSALDLEDTRAFLNFNTQVIGTSNFKYIKNSDIVVLTCGIARKEGMSRLDLFKTNAKIVCSVSKKIKKLAPSSIVIVVTNPLDLITYVVTKHTGFNRQKVMGMGSSLDSARLVGLVHKMTKIPSQNINTLVMGPHSQDMLPLMSLARIKGLRLNNFLTKEKIKIVKEKVKLRGKEIVSYLKDRSASFAPSLSCCRLIEAVTFNKNEMFPVSVLLKGEYGLNNVCMGVPCIINRKGVVKIIELDLEKREKKEILKIKDIFHRSLYSFK